MYRWIPSTSWWPPYSEVPRHSTAVLCLAPAGHGRYPFARWPKSAGNVNLGALQFPGRHDAQWRREHATFEAQAADLVAELRIQPLHRFGFFAHGSSALIAYEAAVRLTQLGGPVPHRLIVSGCPAPNLARPDSPEPSDDELSVQALRMFSEFYTNPLPSLMEMSVLAMRAEAKALRAYDPEDAEPLSIPITAVCWQRDTDVGRDAMADWKRHGTVTEAELDGTQFSYSRAPGELMRILAGEIS
jgi:surfactin synthase thioesterase subunit